MASMKRLEMAALVTAATVGDGIFALPYVFMRAGWFVALCYFAVLGAIVVLAHRVYLETLEKEEEKKRLVGLARTYFGREGFWTALAAIVGGLLLTLLAYLLLGAEFVRLAFPGVSWRFAFVAFWALISVPLFLTNRYARELELAGITATAAAVIAMFSAAFPGILSGGALFAGAPPWDPHYLFLPFGAVLFSLAGWTGIETVYEARRAAAAEEAERTGMPAPRPSSSKERIPWAALAQGTFFAALLYALFSAGILGSAPVVTPDTASGLAGWPLWEREVGALMGLIAVGTAYIPISREIRNSLEKDLGWNKGFVRAVIMFVPPALIGFGLRDFLVVVGIVGGVFLAVQYLLIISVGRRALSLGRIEKVFLDLAAAVFVAAAVYEIASFVVH